MSETIMLPTNYELVVKDKATAMQYAISQARVYNKETRCYDLDLELAQRIFKLFVDNVNLPDVEGDSRADCDAPIKFNVSNNTFSQETADELDVALQDFKKSVDSLSKMSVVEETLQECYNTLLGESDVREQLDVDNTSVKTYADVAKDLFGEKDCFCIDTFANIFICRPSLRNTPHANNCTSRKQAEKLLALNRLMNVAKYLNGDWQPKFYDGNEKKWYIYIDEDGEFDTSFAKELVTTSVYFKSQELAEKAIEILGSHTISLALSTDW